MFPSLVVSFDLHLWVSLKGYGNAKKRKELMKEISNMINKYNRTSLLLCRVRIIGFGKLSLPEVGLQLGIQINMYYVILPSEKSYALFGFFTSWTCFLYIFCLRCCLRTMALSFYSNSVDSELTISFLANCLFYFFAFLVGLVFGTFSA